MAGNRSAEDDWRRMNILTCSHCNLKTSDSALLQAHNCKSKIQQIVADVSYSSSNEMFTCSLCEVQMLEFDFRQHLEGHITLKPYKCSYCEMDTANADEMIQHISQFHRQCGLKFLFKLSRRTKEIIMRAKSSGRDFFKAINPKIMLDHTASNKDKCAVNNITSSQESVAVSAASQTNVQAPLLFNSFPPPVSSSLVLAHSQVPPGDQSVSVGVHPHLPCMQSNHANPCSTRPLFSNNQQPVFFIVPPMTTLPPSATLPILSTHIPQTQVPVSLSFVPVSVPDLLLRLPSSVRHENQAVVSKNFSLVGQNVQSHRTETQMTSSSATISSATQVHSSEVQPFAQNIEGHPRNNVFNTLRPLLNHPNINNLHNISRINSEHSIINESENFCDNFNTGSHIITSQEFLKVPNSTANTEQNFSAAANISDDCTVTSDWSTKINVENVISLSNAQDALHYNISSDGTHNTESQTDTLNETAEQQRRSADSNTFSFLRIVKGYFLCLICKMKWSDHDLFFKHIWQKHVHGTDFSCCPMGYSTGCARLKDVITVIYDKSQESMSSEIRNYFMTHPSIDYQTVNEGTNFEEKNVYSSETHTDQVIRPSSSETELQPNVETDVQSTNATSLSQRNTPYILLQNFPFETFSHCEESNSLINTTLNPEQCGTSVKSYGRKICQNQALGDLTLDNERDDILQKSLGQTAKEATSCTAGTMDTLRNLCEQQQVNKSANSQDKACISKNSIHQDICIQTNMYEDISNDGYDVVSNRGMNKGSSLLSTNHYLEELPLDLSRKATQPETSLISVPQTVNETYVAGSITHMTRISTENIESIYDSDTTLKFFYQCGFYGCLFASSKSHDFQVHYQQTHDSENEFPCFYCGFRNASSNHLIRHMEEHFKNTKTKTFSCSLHENSEKVAHFENNDIRFILRMLNTSFAANSDSAAVLHCACNICRSEFVDLKELEEHLQKSLLKVVECKYCESYFLNSYSWQRHMTTDHHDLPRVYNINKKLLCNDRKMNTNICGQNSHSGSSLIQKENAKKGSETITVQEAHGMSLEPPSVPPDLDNADTETTRVHGKKFETQNVNIQNSHRLKALTEDNDIIHMVLPVGSQVHNLNNPQILAKQKSVNEMELPHGRLESVTCMNTFESFGARDIVENSHTNLQANTVNTRKESSDSIQPITHTVSVGRDSSVCAQPFTHTVSAGRNSSVCAQPISHAVNVGIDSSDCAQPVTHTVSVGRDSSVCAQPVTHTVTDRRGSNDCAQSSAYTISDGTGGEDHRQPPTQTDTVNKLTRSFKVEYSENQHSGEILANKSAGLITTNLSSMYVLTENRDLLKSGVGVSCKDQFVITTSESTVQENVGAETNIGELHVCSPCPIDHVAVKNITLNSGTHPQQTTIVSGITHQENSFSVTDLEVNSSFIEKESSTMRENAISDASIVANVITNISEMDKTERSLVASSEIELPYREEALLQGVRRANIGSRVKLGHCSSKLNSLTITNLTHDNFEPHAQQQREKNNFDPTKIAENQNGSVLKDGRDTNSAEDLILSRSTEVENEKQKLIKIIASCNIQSTAEIYTQDIDHEDPRASVELDGEGNIQQIPIGVASCFNQLPEKEPKTINIDNRLAFHQQSGNHISKRISFYPSKDCSQIQTCNMSHSSIIHYNSASVRNVKDSGDIIKTRSLGSFTYQSQITNNLSNNSLMVDLPIVDHINDSRSNKSVRCLNMSPHKCKDGSGKDIATKNTENIHLGNRSVPGLQQDFSHSRTDKLRAKQNKQDKLTSGKNIPSMDSTTVNREKPTFCSDFIIASDDSSVQVESHIEESSNELPFNDSSHEFHVLPSSREEHDKNSMKISFNHVMNSLKCKQSKSNCQADPDSVALPQKSLTQTNISNSSSALVVEARESSQFSQKTPLTNKSLLKTSSKAVKNASDSVMHRLIDECGSIAMDKCLKSLYTAFDGKFVCKKCKRNFNSLKRIHCHSFYCQGRVGVVHCSECLHQGEHEKAVRVHIKYEHSDKALNTTVSHRYFCTSELMNILQSYSISPDTFLEMCAKLPPPKYIYKNNYMDSVQTNSSKKSVNKTVSKDSSVHIIQEKEGFLLSKTFQAVSANLPEKYVKQQGSEVSVAVSENVKNNTLTAGVKCEDLTTAMGPSEDSMKSQVPCSTLSVIPENAEQPETQEISTVLLYDKTIVTQNLFTSASGRNDENVTSQHSKTEKKNKTINDGLSVKGIPHTKGDSGIIKSSRDVKVSHSSSLVKRKSEDTCSERMRINESASDKEVEANSDGIFEHNDHIKTHEAPKSNKLTEVNSNGRALKEKSEDKKIIKNSGTINLSSVNTDASLNKHSEVKYNNRVSASKIMRINKDIMVSCNDTVLVEKSKPRIQLSGITKSAGEMCSNSTVNEESLDTHDKKISTYKMTSSSKEIKMNSVIKTVGNSSMDKCDDTASIQKSTRLNDEKVSQNDKTPRGKSKVEDKAIRTCETTMDKISHSDTPIGKQSEIKHDTNITASKSSKNKGSNVEAPVNRNSEKSILDVEVNNIADFETTRRSENRNSAESLAAKTVKSSKEIRTGHSDKALKEKPMEGEPISLLSTRSVKCSNETFRKKSNSTAVRSDGTAGRNSIDTTCVAQSFEKEMSVIKITGSCAKSKDNYNETTSNKQLIDKNNEVISTTEMIRSDNENKNCDDRQSRFSGNVLYKVGHETGKASEAVKCIDSAVRRKSSQDKCNVVRSSETTRPDNISCNDTKVRLPEGWCKRKATTEALISDAETTGSFSDSTDRRKPLTAHSEGISTPVMARTVKERKANHTDTPDRRKSDSFSEVSRTPETSRSYSQFTCSESTDKRKSMCQQGQRISTTEISSTVRKLNFLKDTEIVRQSKDKCDEGSSLHKDKKYDKLIKSAAVINQSESKHDDSSYTAATWSCKKMKASHDESAVGALTDKTHDESILTYKFTKINKEASSIGNSLALKRKPERLEERVSKQHRYEGDSQSTTEVHNSDLVISRSVPNTKSSLSQAVKPFFSQELTRHINSNNVDKSEKTSSFSSQSPLSDHLSENRKQQIYECIHKNCDYMCEWNVDNMKEHINKNHPYYSCGYCNAPYTMLDFLKNHLKFVHKGLESRIVSGTIPLQLLFKRVNIPCNSTPQGDYCSDVTDIKYESSSGRKVKKCRKKFESELTTFKNCEERVPSTGDEASVTRNLRDITDISSQMPSEISEKASEEHGVNHSVSQARKPHMNKISQSKPESIWEQFPMENSLASQNEVTASEKRTNQSTINTVSNNAKANRNVFERSSLINNPDVDIESASAIQTTSSKLINTVDKEVKITDKSAVDIPLVKMFKLSSPIVVSMLSKKNIQNNPISSELRECVSKVVEHSTALNATVNLENMSPNETVYKDAFKSSVQSLSSHNVHIQEKVMSKSAAYFNKFQKIPKFKSAAKPNIFESYSQHRMLSKNTEKHDLSLLDISQTTNLTGMKIDAHDVNHTSKRISEASRRDFSNEMKILDGKTFAHKIMTPRSFLKTGSENNCGTWTVSQLEAKPAAEGIQNIEFEPENMRTFLKENTTLQNGSKVTNHSGFYGGKNLPMNDAVSGETSHKSKKEESKTEYPFRCTLCMRFVTCLNDIEEHFQECHPKDVVQLTERISGFVYSNTGQCIIGKDHRKAPTHPHMCRYCPFRSTKRSDVENHITLYHPQKDVLVLSLRKPQSPNPNTTTELSSEITFDDQARGSNQPAVKYHCMICDSVERSEFLFRLHLAKHPCFKHTSSVCSGASFVCSTCGYIAKSNSDLAQHTGDHMLERRFKCFMCEHDSHNKQGIKTHIRSVHNINVDDDAGVIDREKQRSTDLRPRLVNINPQIVLEHFHLST